MRLDHVTVLSDRLDQSIDFYRENLGLVSGPRPAFDFAGAWLYSGDKVLIHLKEGKPDGSGAVEHLALFVDDFAGTVERLRRNGIPHRLQALPDKSLRQCFLRDPNGAMIELTGR